MGDDKEIDSELLISLVRDRPALWDKYESAYKDRTAVKEAWKEVCCGMNEEFEDMREQDQNEFHRAIIKRWANLRDAYSKARRRVIESKRNGTRVKKYCYDEDMQFLNKIYDKEGFDETQEEIDHSLLEVKIKKKRKRPNPEETPRKPEEDVEIIPVTPFEPSPLNSQLCFFQGILPHLNNFDENEILEFQMGVLQLIAGIKSARQNA
ncbi:uncharacterized protein LOC128996975 [Macrosteles quadrilineatus]|uniref:uncharacterized protein LOC128996975 n=1 Tax=Macrosteles quadrilineatus TaxID=74068 RepID=UPI0023E2E1D1|nr:uncharacterized protein LOC128996975 [Macrosteles quadrilineatus]